MPIVRLLATLAGLLFIAAPLAIVEFLRDCLIVLRSYRRADPVRTARSMAHSLERRTAQGRRRADS